MKMINSKGFLNTWHGDLFSVVQYTVMLPVFLQIKSSLFKVFECFFSEQRRNKPLQQALYHREQKAKSSYIKFSATTKHERQWDSESAGKYAHLEETLSFWSKSTIAFSALDSNLLQDFFLNYWMKHVIICGLCW